MSHIAALKKTAPDDRASWARETSLHLTLKFLGNIPKASVADLSEAAAAAVAGIESFPIRLEATGVFPERGHARVLWVGVNDVSGKLHGLQSRLEAQSALVGFPKDERSFSPHLTIARLRHPQDARTLAVVHKQMNFEAAEMNVSELLAIRSELSSAGSKYTVISKHQLGA